MAFIEKKMAGDVANWWATNHAAIEAMQRTCGLRVTERPGHEIYILQTDEKCGKTSSGNSRSCFRLPGSSGSRQ